MAIANDGIIQTVNNLSSAQLIQDAPSNLDRPTKDSLLNSQNIKDANDKKYYTERLIIAADYLNQWVVLKAAYGLLDALSISYSTLSYVCSIATKSSAAKDLLINNVLTSPEGLLAFAAGSVFLVGMSLIANTAGSDAEGVKKVITELWPYLRDGLKGAKNAYKGVSNVLKITGSLSNVNLYFLAMPIGLALGAVHVINRLYYRKVLQWRKQAMKDNEQLRQELLTLSPDTLTDEQIASLKQRIKCHTKTNALAALSSAALGGAIDGLYYQIGILTLATFSTGWLGALSLICAGFLIANILSSAYQERVYQNNLKRTELECRLTLQTKILSQCINSLKTPNPDADTVALYDRYEVALKEYQELKTSYQQLLKPSMKNALLQGLSNGLYAYSALSSLLFSVSLVLMLSGVAVPPVLIISVIFTGLAAVLFFTAFAVFKQHKKQKNTYQKALDKQRGELQETEELLHSIQKNLKTENAALDERCRSSLEQQNVEDKLTNNLVLDDNPQPNFQELFEVIRSLFSGVNKGQKPYDVYWDAEPGNTGQTILTWATLVTSVVYGLVYALRALAKNFSRYKPRADKQDAPKTLSTENNTPEKLVASEGLFKQQAKPPIRKSKSLPNLTTIQAI